MLHMIIFIILVNEPHLEIIIMPCMRAIPPHYLHPLIPLLFLSPMVSWSNSDAITLSVPLSASYLSITNVAKVTVTD